MISSQYAQTLTVSLVTFTENIPCSDGVPILQRADSGSHPKVT